VWELASGKGLKAKNIFAGIWWCDNRLYICSILKKIIISQNKKTKQYEQS